MATSKSSQYEKLVAAGLFLLVAALGWGPFVAAASTVAYIERAFLLVMLALVVLSLAILYDAAERLSIKGRGIYVVAVFCSLPAVGVLITDPGLLPVAMLLLLVSSAIWFATRATGENRRFLLAMLAGLLLIAGYAFFTFAGALAFLFAIWLAVDKSSHRASLSGVLAASYAAGMGLRILMGDWLPYLHVTADTFGPSSIILLSPWRLYVLPVFITLLFAHQYSKSWHLGALITLVVTSGMALITQTSLVAVSAILAPLLAVLAGDLALESFTPDLPKVRRWLLALPLLLTPFLLTICAAFVVDGQFGLPALGWPAATLALILAAVLLVTTLLRLPRWSFALMFAAGIWLGSLFWPRADFLPEEPAANPTYWPWLIAGIVAVIVAAMVARIYYGRPIPRQLLNASGYRYGGLDFRRYSDSGKWEGESAPIEANGDFNFIVFGDITGAESPLTTRRGGFFAFRALVEAVQKVKPLFAISLGDLATSARSLPFRRVRQLLKRMPVPLTAIPGNHDAFRDSTYDLRYFHALFGDDHRTFRLGSTQFVLLNNAWGHFEEDQFVWLEETLNNTDAPFLIVFCHKPVFDLRPGMSYAMERREHAERLHELFRAHEVTAVFSGHIHSLLSESRDGVTYVISGGAGSKLTSAEDEYHYLTIHVSGSDLTVRAHSLDTAVSAPLLELHFAPRSCSSAAAAN